MSITYHSIGLVINLAIAVVSYRKRKLTLNASIVAFLIGIMTFSAHYKFFLMMLIFFITSTTATKIGSKYKNTILETYKIEKVRSTRQVLCNGLIPAVLACIYKHINAEDALNEEYPNMRNLLVLMYFSYLCCCNGDTWASELGILTNSDTYLITTLRKTCKGVNGGISVFGLVVSAIGGSVIAFGFCRFDVQFLVKYAVLGSVFGLVGSLIDSLLGATLQLSLIEHRNGARFVHCIPKRKEYTEITAIGADILSNNSVNLISGIITSLIGLMSGFILCSHEEIY